MASETHPWHELDVAEAANVLDTDAIHGLSDAEVVRRHERYGPNSLPAEKGRPWWRRLGDQFTSPLIYVLVVAALVTFLLEDYLDTIVILIVVFANALIGFIQEGRAEKALDAVRGLLSEKATVVRSGQRHTIDAGTLVPGDIVIVESGDQVPADLRIVRANNLTVNEGALTGESVAQEKNMHPVSDVVLSDRTNMMYAGTVVASGVGYGLVVATGSQTELGTIGRLVSSVSSVTTPLTQRLHQFSVQVTFFILILGATAFAWGVLVQSMPFGDAFLAVVALSVAAIPEGLPAVVTIALAVATRVMAKRNVLIRRLPAVESLGSVSIICTDKTGTLTRNEMTVVQIMTRDAVFSVAGEGYEPQGEISRRDQPVTSSEEPVLSAVARVSALCNRAELRQTTTGQWFASGDPTEAALVALAGKIVGPDHTLDREWEVLDEIPFESERRFMATLHTQPGQENLVLVKGAPERILQMCSTEWNGEPVDVEYWDELMENAARSGERVLALAHTTWTAGDNFGGHSELDNLTLVGMVGVMDPPRQEAAQAIRECHSAGVRVIMITGDHKITAAAIGHQLGLNGGEPLSGDEIDELSDAQLLKRLDKTDIVARANPSHKIRMVGVLQESGALVAMTGDGVNDAPALKAAHVGVAMGLGGTDAARAASDVVLTDDRFESIAVAIKRGRVAFDNIKKSLLFILPTSLGEAGVILIAVFGGLALPVTAGQILWINTVTAITISLALVVERAEPRVMSRGPRPAKEPLITQALAIRITLVGALIVAATFIVFEIELARSGNIDQARTAAVAMIVAGELAYLFQARRFVDSGFVGQNLRGSPVVLAVVIILIVLQAGFTYLPFMNFFFQSLPLDAWILGVIAVLAVAQFLVIEVEKAIWRKVGLRHF
jgi:magnesium-transporting ATPase (P-type)